MNVKIRVQCLLCIMMFWMDSVTVKSWFPTNPSTFHNYLSNSRWILSKTLDYSHGGYSGTFCGEACFVNIGQEEQSLLHYTENGIAELFNGNTVSARQQLLYSFVDTAIVSVYFTDDSYNDNGNEQQISAESMLRHGHFFHHIRFDETRNNEPVLSSHPCGPDIYHGRMLFETSDLFTVYWQVTGPRKEGNIISSYTREIEKN